MTKRKTVFRCSACGASTPQWVGKCPSCEAWNSLAEALAFERPSLVPGGERALPIAEVDPADHFMVPTGVGELDRVLGGGLVAGSVTLVGGEPGIGKSTLLLQLGGAVAAGGHRHRVLYVSAEESRAQVRARAERLGALRPRLWVASETALPRLLAHIGEVGADVVVVDSVQTIADPEIGSAPGTVVQVRECARQLVAEAKQRDIAVLLVGHVTKEGALAGPRVLEHVVDTVLSFEGDRHHALRLLRATKHRFGPTSELGLFEMTDAGLQGVPDASGLFLADRRPGVTGSAVVPTLDGHRPLLVEVQALVARSSLGTPRRSAHGIDPGRLALLLAVLEQRAGVGFGQLDVFALAVGGVRVVEPGADLAVALAAVSSAVDVPLPDDLVACAEVGLGGELRQVHQTPRRLAEAARLGFKRALLPTNAADPPTGIRAVRADSLGDAIAACGLAVA
jgi:DNA repair protein RadA/Sms